MKVRFCRLPHGRDLPPPRRASAGSSGFDVGAAVLEPLVIRPGERRIVPTGFAVEVPQGWEIQVRPRSGLALRHGLTVLNAPGTIDSDYRGEVGVILVHLGQETYTVRRGERIAQLVVARVADAEWEEADELGSTGRGAGGFGSTGSGG